MLALLFRVLIVLLVFVLLLLRRSPDCKVYICICACVLLLLRLWLPLPLLRLAELWELLRNVFVSLCACWALVFEVAHDFLRWLVVDGARWVNSVRGGRSEQKKEKEK